MKRALTLLLSALMLITALLTAGCAAKTEEDKGAIVPIYLSTTINNFDPAYALHDEAGVKILGLIYEGLTRIGTDGKLEKAIAKSWKYTADAAENTYMLEIQLNDTKWNDGRTVSADDFVFAWKRLLEPAFASEAASMLYCVKNARAVKSGDMTVDDIGLYAADTSVLQVMFETDTDYNLFLENCASLALVPLREDAVVKLKDWGSNTATMVTNGPYNLKSYKPGEAMVFERNIYYYRDTKNDKLTKYVTPYRFTVDLTKDAEAQLTSFNAGEIFYDGEIPLSQRAALAKDATVTDMMSQQTYVFNTTKAPFNKPEVRKALSMAIDRSEIVKLVTFAKPSEGVVTEGVFETDAGTSFRKTGGSLISSAADLSGAKSLLSSAGVSSGNITITIRENPVDRAVAEYVAGVWGQLGFKVTVKALGMEYYMELEYDQYKDLFENAYRSGDFDVIAIDQNMLSVDAFTTLAAYSKPFSGGALDLASGNYNAVPGVSGYNNGDYDAIIEKAYTETDKSKRAELLHQAEKMLIDAMPVMPLFVYQDAYVVSSELTGIKTTYFGYKIFSKASLKDYKKYLPTTAAEAAASTTAASK